MQVFYTGIGCATLDNIKKKPPDKFIISKSFYALRNNIEHEALKFVTISYHNSQQS